MAVYQVIFKGTPIVIQVMGPVTSELFGFVEAFAGWMEGQEKTSEQRLVDAPMAAPPVDQAPTQGRDALQP